jgi:hypothetical protein
MLVEASEQVSRLNRSVLGIPTRPGVVDSSLQFATVDLTLVDGDAAFGMLRERSARPTASSSTSPLLSSAGADCSPSNRASAGALERVPGSGS